MKDALLRFLSSMKVWTMIIGTLATAGAAFLTKYGLELSDATVQRIAEIMALGFGVLLGAQGASEFGRAAAIAKASSPEPTSTNIGTNLGTVNAAPTDPAPPSTQPPPPIAGASVLIALGIVILTVFGVGCGPSARQTAIRATYASAITARTQFEAWDRAHTMAIAKAATSAEDGFAKLDAYIQARKPIDLAFEIVFASIAVAASLDNETSLVATVAALKDLYDALQKLTGKDLK